MSKIYTQKELEESCKDAYKDGFIKGNKIGWFEGIIDGEGSLDLVKDKRYDYWYPRLRIANTSEEMLNEVKIICIGGSVHLSSKNIKEYPRWKVCYEYCATGEVVKRILPQINLIVKERQQRILLNFIELYDIGISTKNNKTAERIIKRFDKELKLLNKRGGGV